MQRWILQSIITVRGQLLLQLATVKLSYRAVSAPAGVALNLLIPTALWAHSLGLGVVRHEVSGRSPREQEEGESGYQATKYVKEVRGAR